MSHGRADYLIMERGHPCPHQLMKTDKGVRVLFAGILKLKKMKPDPWKTGGLPELNVAMTRIVVDILGPGTRAVVWVQGCEGRCEKCISPKWRNKKPERLVTPEILADELLQNPDVTGLTLSGGEPMLQASGLAALVNRAREIRELSVITYTGYTLDELREEPPGPGVDELLDATDVLIDGRFKISLEDNKGIRGSSNQRIHYLTDWIKPLDYDFVGREREAEIFVEDGGILVLGVPPSGLTQALRELGEEEESTSM